MIAQPAPQQPQVQHCPECRGRGSKFYRSASGQEFIIPCKNCNQTGVVQLPQQVSLGEFLNRFSGRAI